MYIQQQNVMQKEKNQCDQLKEELEEKIQMYAQQEQVMQQERKARAQLELDLRSKVAACTAKEAQVSLLEAELGQAQTEMENASSSLSAHLAQAKVGRLACASVFFCCSVLHLMCYRLFISGMERIRICL